MYIEKQTDKRGDKYYIRDGMNYTDGKPLKKHGWIYMEDWMTRRKAEAEEFAEALGLEIVES